MSQKVSGTFCAKHPSCRSGKRFLTPFARPSARRGFTLVELLVTITVLAILMTAVLGGMRMANESARTARTRATITKLSDVIMEQYESYHNRRVPKDLKAYAQQLAGAGQTVKPEHYARAKVNALKDLMRMEMPDRWSDVTGSPLVLNSVPVVTQSYRRARQRALDNGVNSDTVEEWGAAECLYLIVTSNPDAAASFNSTEVGDMDRDGLMEFIDGWGNPIRYLRWPAGFVGAANSDLQTGGAPDPFNPSRASVSDTAGAGFALYPLIYSAGPDKIYDINIGKTASNATYRYQLNSNNNVDPYVSDGQGYRIGLPADAPGIGGIPSNGVLDHYDNIHNHMLLVR